MVEIRRQRVVGESDCQHRRQGDNGQDREDHERAHSPERVETSSAGRHRCGGDAADVVRVCVHRRSAITRLGRSPLFDSGNECGRSTARATARPRPRLGGTRPMRRGLLPRSTIALLSLLPRVRQRNASARCLADRPGHMRPRERDMARNRRHACRRGRRCIERAHAAGEEQACVSCGVPSVVEREDRGVTSVREASVPPYGPAGPRVRTRSEQLTGAASRAVPAVGLVAGAVFVASQLNHGWVPLGRRHARPERTARPPR